MTELGARIVRAGVAALAAGMAVCAGLHAEVCVHGLTEKSIDLNGLWDFRFERGKSL